MRGPPELATLPVVAHPVAPLLRHASEHGVPIVLPQGVDGEVKDASLCYGTHVSSLKETEFIYMELSE